MRKSEIGAIKGLPLSWMDRVRFATTVAVADILGNCLCVSGFESCSPQKKGKETTITFLKYTFEVGGKGKGFKQIADLPSSYIVSDGMEVGIGNKIPLWLFGFLY